MRASTWIGIALLCGAVLESSAVAIPPPTDQYTANCQNPTYASDQLICNDDDLRSLDQTMSALLEWNPELAQRQGSVFFETQSAWLRRRSLCAMKEDHETCLRAAYADRYVILKAFEHGSSDIGQVSHCGAVDGSKKAVWIDVGNQSVLLMDRHKAVIGVASVGRDRDVWQPFVRADRMEGIFQFTTLSGETFSCRPDARTRE